VDWRAAFLLNASVERKPAMSAMATMPNATNTSMRVKPWLEGDFGGAAVDLKFTVLLASRQRA
jgi:hypothetical protein